MCKKEDLAKEYRFKRRSYEDAEDKLLRQRDLGIAAIDEVQTRSSYYLRDYVPDQDILFQGLGKLDHMKEDILETSKVEHKKIVRKIEDLDREYSSKLRQLNKK